MNAQTQNPAASVVVIDDTPDLRNLLRIALERSGYAVVGEAGDGQSGIEAIRLHRPEVVLLDLAMPTMDGIEALPSIRRLVPDAKIVVLSGFGASQMSERAVAAGADGYVQKGAPLKSIIAYVNGISSGSPAGNQPLSVVRTDAVPAAPADVVRAATTESLRAPAAEPAPPHVSAWDALRLAPYGVVEVADDPLFRVMHVNAAAARLIGSDTSGMPLAVASPELASLVAYYRLDSDAVFEADLAGGRVKATLRRTASSVLVFLDSAAEDVGLLRRAIATTAHEVRGPVAVLCGVAETLTWDGPTMSPDQTARLMASVTRQAHILDRITADLLTAAQIQRGTLRVDLAVVDPVAVVTGILEDRYDAEIVVDDTRNVVADPLRLEQMVTNLLSNAAKYGSAPYVVRIRPDADLESGYVCIDVVDHGNGVPDNFTEHLFREYARSHDAVASGNGLGLYVVRTLARAQNGDISYAPGETKGSVFTIRLRAV